MHRQRGNEEVLALAMQTVRYPRRGEVRYFVSLGEELFVDEPISEDTSTRIHIPPDLSHLPSHCRNVLFRFANVGCQRIQRRRRLRKRTLGASQRASSL